MAGVSYVDVECFDMTDHSSCGRLGQLNKCSTGYPLSDYAADGIVWSNQSTHDSIKNIRIHGMAVAGMLGPTGDAVTMDHIELIANASSGWSADLGDKTTGSGSLTVTHYDISWNGCAEEYPIVDKLPYQDCTDDGSFGYGDGFGTASVDSNPGWKVHFDDGVVSYNTQDGLDALHISGPGSSMTVTRTLAYGNMGQQLKIGGTSGRIQYDEIFTNCNAMRLAIPGTPAGYNKRLGDFCRAADTGLVFTVNNGSTAVFSDNIVYSASTTTIQVNEYHSCTDDTCVIKQQNNIFLGFRSTSEAGYPHGGSGDYANELYVQKGAERAYKSPDSIFNHNVTFYPGRGSWGACGAKWLDEKNASCSDPHLTDETWHPYGYANVGSRALHPEGAAPPDR
jgi:hypothetical protein